ncbi:UDP-glucose 4-epimerase GalE [Homoserinimonas hongtaonis]|uniref:UDP-glucose 4-epimerase GalE n=1 Tax=Homoserinimonas hongtaonis TaxID=2079791 RepID=UPI000D36EE51|nr:UDP-glucose 4-epimerase GalE [Salinibacterium hongtaonis]AWB90134.1 UDP-glucose 4-epimerase GalE [Salinibacterium hongtaonis]
MRVLLTGGAGYIGTHVAVELIEQGHSVVIADDLSNSSAEAVRRVEQITGASIPLVVADLSRPGQADHVLAEHPVDAIIHLAAFKAVGESVAQPLEYYRNNIDSTLELLAAMKRHGVSRFVFSSSGTAYEEPITLPLVETAPTGLAATNPYSRSKAIIERILVDVAASDPDLQVAILRYFNPVGNHPSGLIGEDPLGIPNNLMPFVSQVAGGRRDRVSVFGDTYDTPDGTGVRDYVHVMDLATGHVAALATLAPGVEAYNLGTGRGTSVLELIAAYSAVVGRQIPYEIVPPRPGDAAATYANVDKANRELHWRATRSLEDACRDAWAWQSANPRGYES